MLNSALLKYRFKTLLLTALSGYILFSHDLKAAEGESGGGGDTIAPSYAAEATSSSDFSGGEIVRQSPTPEFFAPLRISLSQTFGQSIGTRKPYTTLEGQFFMLAPVENLWPFLDLRIHRFSDDYYGFNGGIGFRYMLEGCGKIIGINFYEDFQNNRFNNFNQFGIGFEFIGSCLSLRLNGYLPFGKTHGKWDNPCMFNEYSNGYFTLKQEFEASFKGIDGEIEWTILNHCQLRVSLAAGPYYYIHEVKCEDNIFGGRLCLRGFWCKYLNFSVEATYDELYHSRVQAQIGITIPFCSDLWSHNCCCFSNLLFEPVWRNETIVRDRYCEWFWNW